MKIVIDTQAATLTREQEGVSETLDLYSKEGFEALSLQWLRTGWSLKYYHTFSWMGLPVLQLPEDMLRMQEVIHQVRPQVIIETGIFQGGSLIYYASLLEVMGLKDARVIGIDLEIPAHVRSRVETHPLGQYITMIEGSSISSTVVGQAKQLAQGRSSVLVILDSDHSRAHVAAELELYAPLVTPGSYIVATDGIMKDIWDVPRALAAWREDNPYSAANDFAARHPEFLQRQPPWPARDSVLDQNVTYWPGAWFQRQ